MPKQRNAAGPTGENTPLSFAVASRDSETLDMVDHAVRSRNVKLAYQPVVQALAPTKPAFFEGLIRVMDETGRTIPAREFIDQIETHEIGRIIDCLALDLGLGALAVDPDLKLSINMSARSIGYKRWLTTLEQGIAQTPNLQLVTGTVYTR